MRTQRTEADFIEWLSGATFEIGYARYGQLGGHGFVVATAYEYEQNLHARVDDLDGRDNDALYAEKYILDKSHFEERSQKHVWYANDPNPMVAMRKLLEQLKEYYFQVLNGDKYKS